MPTTTFGYDPAQDRIWMRSHQPDFTIWFTRRLIRRMLGPMLRAFVDQTPGPDGMSTPAQRVAIEHQLALQETTPGGRGAHIKTSQVQPGEDADPQQRLCRRITTTANELQTILTFETTGGSATLKLRRQGMHMWLRGLNMTMQKAQWDLPDDLVPHWLQADMLPEPVRKLVREATQSSGGTDHPPRQG